MDSPPACPFSKCAYEGTGQVRDAHPTTMPPNIASASSAHRPRQLRPRRSIPSGCSSRTAAKIVGVADADEKGRAEAVKRVSAPKAYADYRQCSTKPGHRSWRSALDGSISIATWPLPRPSAASTSTRKSRCAARWPKRTRWWRPAKRTTSSWRSRTRRDTVPSCKPCARSSTRAS